MTTATVVRFRVRILTQALVEEATVTDNPASAVCKMLHHEVDDEIAEGGYITIGYVSSCLRQREGGLPGSRGNMPDESVKVVARVGVKIGCSR